MIILYYKTSNGSCRKAMEWFRKHDIEVFEKNIAYIAKKDLLEILALSRTGFSDILKKRTRCEKHVKAKIEKISSLSFNEAVTFTLMNPDMLKVPLILGENKYVVGYNSETIRTFIPKSYRNLELNTKKFL
ncbi:ArsC/Spx/MgsR family protein [Lactococcus petauri]|uniref:ArsC/Spx/MgsR family protein n=1 Tax=Lactococcus petauri TaxID=1940789 RepID=UPI003853D35C